MQLGQPDQAEVSFREAIRLDPGFCDAHSDLGALLAVRGQNDEARYHLETALQIRPDDPVARSNLERFLAESGERASSRQAAPHHSRGIAFPEGVITTSSRERDFRLPTLMDTSGRIKR